jgi:hypothetical protein
MSSQPDKAEKAEKSPGLSPHAEVPRARGARNTMKLIVASLR